MGAVQQTTTIVIPCYDEAARLDPQAFDDALARWPWLNLLFVDDGSRDRTAEILERLRAARPARVQTLRLPQNVGKGEAVRQGLLAAAQGGSPILGFIDADLATPLAELEPMRELLCASEAELVLGSRVKLLGREISRNPLRHYAGRVFATCASLALSIGVYDTQCGAKLLRNSPTVQAVLARPFRTRWIFDVELISRLMHALQLDRHTVERALVEYPLRRWRHVGGSKVALGTVGRAAIELALIGLSHRLGGPRG